MEKSKNKMSIINLSANQEDIFAYNYAENFTYIKNRWVNFGKDNDYPSYLRTLYLSSPTHQNIVNSTVNLATADGITVKNIKENPLSAEFITKNFPKDFIKKLISDLKIFGYCIIQVYNNTIYKYSEAIKYRSDFKDDNNNINFMWYSEDWDNYNLKKNRPVKIPIWTENTEEELSVIICQLDKAGFEYYSPVDYHSAINWINLEKEISIYHLSNIKNGLFPSFIINVIGTEFSDEQQSKFEKDIINKFSGSDNSGKVIINFAASQDDKTSIDTIEQSGLHETYQFLAKEVSEKIMLGHGVTSPILFGIRTETGLGNNANELETAYSLYYQSKLVHYQNSIIQMIKKIMNSQLLFADIEFITKNPFSAIKSNDVNMSNEDDNINEINLEYHLNSIKSSAIKLDDNDIIIDEQLTNKFDRDKIYKFYCINENNIISKRFDILNKQGYFFKGTDVIKNTKNYYFKEIIITKKMK